MDGHSTELHLPAAILLNFRFAAIDHWRITKTTLLLHSVPGPPPSRVELAIFKPGWNENNPPRLRGMKLNFLGFKTEPRPDGWFSVQVAPVLIELLGRGEGSGLILRENPPKPRLIHARESIQFSPYLIVEGEPGP